MKRRWTNYCGYQDAGIAKPRCGYRMKYFECGYGGHCDLQRFGGSSYNEVKL